MNEIDKNVLEALGLRGQTAPASERKDPERLGQKDFMKLMIAQLTHQDPFEPMQGGEFLGQLAQFGTVSGIEDVQSSIRDLSDALRSNQTVQAASLVDRRVLVPAHEAWLPPGGSVEGAVAIPESALDATLGVYDLSGELVHRLSLTPDQSGMAEFAWDGSAADGRPLPPGFYELRAEGSLGGSVAALEVHVAGRVESVSTDAGGGRLALTVTGLGEVALNQVKSIR